MKVSSPLPHTPWHDAVYLDAPPPFYPLGFLSIQAVVMDVGSGWTRMGLAGEDKPSCSFPSIVGRIDLKVYDQLLGQV